MMRSSETLEGIVTSWNKAAERIFGYTAAEMLGQPISRLAPPGRADEIVGILGRIKAGERVEHYETERRRKDGRIIQVALTISPIRNQAGQIVGASKIARDITQTKLAETALSEREAHLRSILGTVPDGMIVIDERGIIQSFSATAERMFGFTAGEVCGRNVSILMPSPYREGHDSLPLPHDRREADHRPRPGRHGPAQGRLDLPDRTGGWRSEGQRGIACSPALRAISPSGSAHSGDRRSCSRNCRTSPV
jgi:PAS domain S-box-containing protein